MLTRRREPDAAPEHRAGRSNLLQLMQLRWIAVGGQLVTILVAAHRHGRATAAAARCCCCWPRWSLFNLASWWRSRGAQRVIGNHELFFGLLVDVAVLSGLLYFSGGVSNPFIFLFLLQVAVGAVLLPPRHTWTMVGADLPVRARR